MAQQATRARRASLTQVTPTLIASRHDASLGDLARVVFLRIEVADYKANDRCFRLGQKRPVHVHTFVATSRRGTTVDEVLDELLTRKRELMRQFVVPMGGFEVTSDDMLAKVA